PINIMDKEKFYRLWQVFNGKVKNLANQGLGERNGSEGFTEEELLMSIDHPTMSGKNPTSLFFIRRKDKYKQFDVKSKTNQHGANNIDSQADSHFYLKPCNINEEIKKFMKNIITLTGLDMDDRKISNHSGRKTLVQILKRRGFSISECMVSTRHKTEQGLASYERSGIEIQHNNAANIAEAFGFNKNNKNKIGKHEIFY
ncbi:15738_t:CDS:2, partial [Funneliformis geosporum]